MAKGKKLRKPNKNIAGVKTPKPWYKKHFILEVLYYVPYTYITIFRLLLKLISNVATRIIYSVKTHSVRFGGYIRDLVQTFLKRFTSFTDSLTLREIKLPKLNIPIRSYFVRELKLVKKELKDLVEVVNRLFSSPVKTPNIKKKNIKVPSNLIVNVKLRVFSIARIVQKIILFPFRSIWYGIKVIFNFEIRFKLFSIRTFLLVAFLVGIYLGSAAYFIIYNDLPSVDPLAVSEPRQTTTIYDRKGNVLYRLYNDEDRSLVPLNQIPQDLIDATIAIEDESFYDHKGLSFRGIVRAAKRTFFEDDLEGGSTITQQLVKNTILTPEQTYERKMKEALIAIEVERRYSKNQILEMYLNRISYGGTAYGIKSAAKRYFGKELEDLTLAESAYLAGLPVAPSKYSPFAGNLEAGKARQRLVLNRMVSAGYITQQESDIAFEEELAFESQTERIIAPHFVNYVIASLEEKYGQLLVSQGGLDVFTSLDLELQTELEQIVKNEVSTFSRNNVSNGAALITDPKTGEVLAMVGSVDYWDTEHDGKVNITISPRQPGSSIKPLTYSLALENGYTASTIINDTPVSYKIPGQPDYSPVNYDGSFHGRVTLKQALANSYNIPAVKVLDKFGVQSLVEHGKNMGITTWNDSSRFGLSLTLGAGEVKMTDMAVVYGTFANQGVRRDLNPVLKVYDSYGNLIEENDCVDFLEDTTSILTRREWFETNAIASTNTGGRIVNTCKGERVLSDFTAYMITNILTDNRARTPAFGANSELNVTAKQFAVKTGTTNDLKDNWAIGYNDDYVIVTWIGNNYNERMNGVVSGYHGASSIWRDTVDYLINSDQTIAEKISRPANLVEVEICPITNTLACSGCPNITQIYKRGTEPKYACNPEVVKEILNPSEDEEDEENKEESED